MSQPIGYDLWKLRETDDTGRFHERCDNCGDVARVMWPFRGYVYCNECLPEAKRLHAETMNYGGDE